MGVEPVMNLEISLPWERISKRVLPIVRDIAEVEDPRFAVRRSFQATVHIFAEKFSMTFLEDWNEYYGNTGEGLVIQKCWITTPDLSEIAGVSAIMLKLKRQLGAAYKEKWGEELKIDDYVSCATN